MLLKCLLFLIAFVVGADELMLGPILMPIGHDLGVAPERVTLFITAYSVALAIIAPTLGALSDRYGRLNIMLPAAILFGFASIATGLVASFEIGLATRVITGIASAGMLPIAFAMAADAPAKEAVRRIAWVQAGLTFGMISSPAFGALVAEWFSWRTAFMVLGVAAWVLAMGLVVQSLNAKKASQAVATLAEGHTTKDDTVKENTAFQTPDQNEEQTATTTIWALPGAKGALLAMCLGLGGGIGLFNLVGQHLRDQFAVSMWLVGGLYAALGVISVIGNMLMPRAIAIFGNGRRVMRGALVACVIVSVAFYAAPVEHWTLLLVPLFFWSMAGGIGSPALQSYIAQLSQQHRGMLMSMGMTMMHIGVALWSAVAGLAYSYGVMAMSGVAMLLFGGAIWALRPSKNRAPI